MLARVGSDSGAEAEFGGLLQALRTLVQHGGSELSTLSAQLWSCNELIRELVQRNPLQDVGWQCGSGENASLLTDMCRGSMPNSEKVVSCLIESMSETFAEIARRTKVGRRLHAQRKLAFAAVLAVEDEVSPQRVQSAMGMLLSVLKNATESTDGCLSQSVSVGQLAELFLCMSEHEALAAAVGAAVDEWSWLVEWLDHDSSPERQDANSSRDVRDVVERLDKMRYDLRGGARLPEHRADGLAISVSDAGTDYANGVYYYHGELNGHPLYQRVAMAPPFIRTIYGNDNHNVSKSVTIASHQHCCTLSPHPAPSRPISLFLRSWKA